MRACLSLLATPCPSLLTARRATWQLILFGLCWAINLSPAGLAVAFLIVSLVPLREHVLPHIFTQVELERLDGGSPAGERVSGVSDVESVNASSAPEGAAAVEEEEEEVPSGRQSRESREVEAPSKPNGHAAPPATAENGDAAWD